MLCSGKGDDDDDDDDDESNDDDDDNGKGKVSCPAKCGSKWKGGKYYCDNDDVSLSLTFYLLHSNTGSWYCTPARAMMMARTRANTARERVTVALSRVTKREREVPEWATMMMGDGRGVPTKGKQCSRTQSSDKS